MSIQWTGKLEEVGTWMDTITIWRSNIQRQVDDDDNRLGEVIDMLNDTRDLAGALDKRQAEDAAGFNNQLDSQRQEILALSVRLATLEQDLSEPEPTPPPPAPTPTPPPLPTPTPPPAPSTDQRIARTHFAGLVRPKSALSGAAIIPGLNYFYGDKAYAGQGEIYNQNADRGYYPHVLRDTKWLGHAADLMHIDGITLKGSTMKKAQETVDKWFGLDPVRSIHSKPWTKDVGQFPVAALSMTSVAIAAADLGLKWGSNQNAWLIQAQKVLAIKGWRRNHNGRSMLIAFASAMEAWRFKTGVSHDSGPTSWTHLTNVLTSTIVDEDPGSPGLSNLEEDERERSVHYQNLDMANLLVALEIHSNVWARELNPQEDIAVKLSTYLAQLSDLSVRAMKFDPDQYKGTTSRRGTFVYMQDGERQIDIGPVDADILGAVNWHAQSLGFVNISIGVPRKQSLLPYITSRLP